MGKKKATSKAKGKSSETPPISDTSIMVITICAKLDQHCDDQRGWDQTPADHLVILQSLVAELTKIQIGKQNNNPLNHGNRSSKESWDIFWKWIDQHTSQIGKCEISKDSMRNTIELGWMGDSFGNGCTAQRDIGENEVIMNIPVELMLCCHTGHASQNSPLPPFLATDRVLGSSTMALSLLVAHEKLMGEKSFFAPYLSLLPTSFDVPIYWEAEDLALIGKASPEILKKACNGWRMACKNYCYIVSLVQTNKLSHIFSIPGLNLQSTLPSSATQPVALSFEMFKWAISVSVTRQNEIPIPTQIDSATAAAESPPSSSLSSSGSISALALIPVWDMCNHSSDQVTSQTFVQREQSPYCNGSLECITHVPFKAGEEVGVCFVL